MSNFEAPQFIKPRVKQREALSAPTQTDRSVINDFDIERAVGEVLNARPASSFQAKLLGESSEHLC
jgi:hypothetical protein